MQIVKRLTQTITCYFIPAWNFFHVEGRLVKLTAQLVHKSKLHLSLIKVGRSQIIVFKTLQFSSVTQSCPTLRPQDSTPGLPDHHQFPEFTKTHVHWVGDAIQPSHPLSSPSPAPNPSQHQGLFQWVSSSHEVAKVLAFQLHHQSFQWTPRTDLL